MRGNLEADLWFGLGKPNIRVFSGGDLSHLEVGAVCLIKDSLQIEETLLPKSSFALCCALG